MNRAFGIRCSLVFAAALALSVAACHPRTSPVTDLAAPPATLPCCQYTVTGGVAQAGPQTLEPGDTVSIVLARILPTAPGKPMTIVLIRQAPEGKTQQLIQLDPTGQLMDQKQNWTLRNGDELVFPGGQAANSTRIPNGPPPRTAE